MKTTNSVYYSPNIKRKQIFEPHEVEIGYEFVLRLVTLRMCLGETRPLTKDERTERFKRDKNQIARQMGYDSYVVMPTGAKSFESRCSSIQRVLPIMKFTDIARFEKAYNEGQSLALYESVMEELGAYLEKMDQRERIHRLMRRMCNYSVPFVFKPKEGVNV